MAMMWCILDLNMPDEYPGSEAVLPAFSLMHVGRYAAHRLPAIHADNALLQLGSQTHSFLTFEVLRHKMQAPLVHDKCAHSAMSP